MRKQKELKEQKRYEKYANIQIILKFMVIYIYKKLKFLNIAGN